MEKQLVVARYREDLRWLGHTDLETIVYRKDKWASTNFIRMQVRFSRGNEPEVVRTPVPLFEEEMPHVTIVDLPNDPKGREAHSYLYHIVNNYYYLADTTFFLQGKPFDHSPGILDLLKLEYSKPWSLSSFYLHDWDRGKARDLILNLNGQEIRMGNGQHHPSWYKLPGVWSEIFPKTPLPNPYYFGYGALWAVPKEQITQRPLKFWTYLFENVSEIDGWVMELLWNYVFDDSEVYKDLIRTSQTKLSLF
jgi:hypothetical protein